MYICSNCQSEFSKWAGQCENCKQWNTFVEQEITDKPTKGKKVKKSKAEPARSVRFCEIKAEGGSEKPILTGIHEFDQTIGGRIVEGQVILLAGSPGIGKSTLSLDITEKLSSQGKQILYVSGEESPAQIKHRADRLELGLENVSFLPEYNAKHIEKHISSRRKNIDFVIVDSIQTLFSPDVASTAGSVSQISESTNILVNLAKGFSIPMIIIGHVTKSGDIAGPKILEHMVDTVLYFEGDKKHDLRMLRVEKNRFGPTDEVGIFKMTEAGLKEVQDTKELFDLKKDKEPGSVYGMAVHGNRPVVVEVQALATKSYFSIPKRTTSNFDVSRLNILLAIIDKKLRLKSHEYDVYVNITGGINFKDPGLDLPVLKAIVSSIKNEPVARTEIYFGEVGLTGEVRKVFMHERREKEAKRLGFETKLTKQV